MGKVNPFDQANTRRRLISLAQRLIKFLQAIIVMAFLVPTVTASTTVAITAKVSSTPQTLKDQVYELASEYNQDPVLAMKIITCESKAYGASAVHENLDANGNVWSTDIGPWQINNYYHTTEAKRLGLDIYNTEDNLRYGFILLSQQGTKPWTASEKCWAS